MVGKTLSMMVIMVFSDSDEGLFYLSSAEKQRRKYDKSTSKLQKRYILKET
jgi:hypothetical protein